MDLTKLDRPGLARLSDRLQTIATAADVMAEGGLEPEISLTAEATVLRAAPILSHGSEPPEPVLVEDLPDLPVVIEDAPQVAGPDAVPMEAPVAKNIDPPAGSFSWTPPDSQRQIQRRAIPARSKKAPADAVKTGPLTEDERAEILRRHAAGEENASIARALNRRAQSIGLFLAAQNQKGKPKKSKGDFKPIGEAAQAVVDAASAQREDDVSPGQPAPAATAAEGQDPDQAAGGASPAAELPAPVAGGAGDGILGGDRGGLQRDSLAEHDPVQAADVAEKVPPTAAEAPTAPPIIPRSPGEDLHGLDRRIWQHLASLPMARGWDDDLDLDMVVAFGTGGRANMIAADLGVDSRQMLDRYHAITAVIRDDRGHMTIDGQTAFIRVLRLWVNHRRQQAA